MKGQTEETQELVKHKNIMDSEKKYVIYPFRNQKCEKNNNYQEFQEKKRSQLVLTATAGLKRTRTENKDRNIS